MQVPQQEVDIERPLVGLVDDDRVILAQFRVTAGLGQQDAVGHHLDEGILACAIGETDLGTDLLADLHAQLVGDARGHRTGGDAAWLGVPDHRADTEPEFEAHLGQLRGLAGTGLAAHDHDLVVPDRLDDLFAPLRDRQLLGVGHLGSVCLAEFIARDRPLHVRADRLLDPGPVLGIGLSFESLQPTDEPPLR